MKIFNVAAIVFLAGTGLVAQSISERFQTLQPELDRLFASQQYKEVIDRIETVIPSATPAFNKDDENLNIGMASFSDFEALQSLHVYLGRACVMYGHLEKAIINFREAEEIAKLNASEVDDVFGPIIDNWNIALEESKKALESLETITKQKADIEAKGKKQTKQDKQVLARIKEGEPFLKENVPIWQANLERAPAIVEQLGQIISRTKADITKFAPVVAALEEDIRTEAEMIETRFSGDKTKYVESVIGTEENISNLAGREDKIKFLNRLMFLDPQNTMVREQLDLLLGKS